MCCGIVIRSCDSGCISSNITFSFNYRTTCSSRWLLLVDAETKRFCDQMHRILKKKAGEVACKARGAPAATPDDVAAAIYANVL